MLAQKGQQVDFALDLTLGLDLVDAQQEASLGGLDQVVAVHRALRDADRADDTPKIVIFAELLEERFVKLGVCSHEDDGCLLR
jgi:hypothetical protein